MHVEQSHEPLHHNLHRTYKITTLIIRGTQEKIADRNSQIRKEIVAQREESTAGGVVSGILAVGAGYALQTRYFGRRGSRKT
jgi:hypothetical protein